jgi:hypothetical protein
MKLSLVISILFMCSTWFLAAHMYLQTKCPGKGLKMIENFFKETISFEEAITALKEGNKIRRKSERKGYAKIVITSGKTRKEKFGTYWVSSSSDISDYCSFSIEDVIATDWIIDEEAVGDEKRS